MSPLRYDIFITKIIFAQIIFHRDNPKSKYGQMPYNNP